MRLSPAAAPPRRSGARTQERPHPCRGLPARPTPSRSTTLTTTAPGTACTGREAARSRPQQLQQRCRRARRRGRPGPQEAGGARGRTCSACCFTFFSYAGRSWVNMTYPSDCAGESGFGVSRRSCPGGDPGVSGMSQGRAPRVRGAAGEASRRRCRVASRGRRCRRTTGRRREALLRLGRRAPGSPAGSASL